MRRMPLTASSTTSFQNCKTLNHANALSSPNVRKELPATASGSLGSHFGAGRGTLTTKDAQFAQLSIFAKINYYHQRGLHEEVLELVNKVFGIAFESIECRESKTNGLALSTMAGVFALIANLEVKLDIGIVGGKPRIKTCAYANLFNCHKKQKSLHKLCLCPSLLMEFAEQTYAGHRTTLVVLAIKKAWPALEVGFLHGTQCYSSNKDQSITIPLPCYTTYASSCMTPILNVLYILFLHVFYQGLENIYSFGKYVIE